MFTKMFVPFDNLRWYKGKRPCLQKIVTKWDILLSRYANIKHIVQMKGERSDKIVWQTLGYTKSLADSLHLTIF